MNKLTAIIFAALISCAPALIKAQGVVRAETGSLKTTKPGKTEKQERKQARRDEQTMRKEFRSASVRHELKEHKTKDRTLEEPRQERRHGIE
jgi:hypothetical protein